MIMRRKYCSGCRKYLIICFDEPTPEGEHHPKCNFHRRQDTPDGHGYYCKPCAKEAEMTSREKASRKELKRIYMRDYMRRYYHEVIKTREVAS